jgi:DNA modification methylase
MYHKTLFDFPADGSNEPIKFDTDENSLQNYDIEKFGTFSESKSAPIHRWFQYPAGFSYRAVEYVLDRYNIQQHHKVYDPFAGTGTTLLVCKSRGIESYGTEAHPFVYEIAKTKLYWDYDYPALQSFANSFVKELRLSLDEYKKVNITDVPELLKKCYSTDNLQKLFYIKILIDNNVPEKYKSLFNVALVGTLRKASGAATGWPYIAPKKKIEEKDGIETFIQQLFLCINDLLTTPIEYRQTPSILINGDCRNKLFDDEYFDLIFTSPPYLNNYDYADRTRLETYFMGFAKTWSDITEKVRKKLIMAATTQVKRTEYNVEDIVSDYIKAANPKISKIIQEKVNELSVLRGQKGGKKSYDIMVGQYFNDMTLVLINTYKYMKPGAKQLLILGDSAPYGVHIPTETFLGEIALGVGYKNYDIVELRKRGEKWKGNTQRHHVSLRESILILEK